MPKAPRKKRHAALADQMNNDGKLRTVPMAKANRIQAAQEDDMAEFGTSEHAIIDGRTGKKLMAKIAAQQRESLDDNDEEIIEQSIRDQQSSEKSRNSLDLSLYAEDDNDEYGIEEGDEEEYEYEYDFGKVSDAERRALEMFLPGAGKATQKQTLADLIDQKFREHDEQAKRGVKIAQEGETQMKSMVSREVVNVYRQVGLFLKKYTSGKIPKPFKVIPSLKNWEEILYFTNPAEWSPQATHAATKLFAANLNPQMAQRFYNLVLLPRVLDDIENNAKLNFHFYESLRCALYKPTAFFKGIILPIAELGCRAKQAIVFSSVLAKSSIRVLHSSVALLKLSQMPYNGPQTLFMKTLLNKKYALPLPVLHSLSDYFASFAMDGREFPLLFYQCFLVFVQRYKTQLTPEQKVALRLVAKKKPHGSITEEIRRELLASAPLDAVKAPNHMED